ncbi:hypothetical protein EG339_00770 [Chryseobacterium bernardetii]|uniref:Uncharacterized protein n=2 Tax=Chryseobacterium bernardetii TaxID=1241978 RepID=A0A3G6TB34_9FLAO|nr:hypothetical protein EG339_00770 [Chryseobacterium bernardetii]
MEVVLKSFPQIMYVAIYAGILVSKIKNLRYLLNQRAQYLSDVADNADDILKVSKSVLLIFNHYAFFVFA